MRLLKDQAALGKAIFMGDACWGPAHSMLQPAALEQLYQQKLITVEVDGAPVFIPLSND